MALPVVSLAMNVFRHADADAAVVYWFRKGVCLLFLEGLPGTNTSIMDHCSDIQDIDQADAQFTRGFDGNVRGYPVGVPQALRTSVGSITGQEIVIAYV